MNQQSKDQALLQILDRKSAGTITLFESGGAYKLYEDDALLVANTVLLSEVGLRKILSAGRELTCLNLNAAQYARAVKDLLLLLRYRVEVYEERGGKFSVKAKGIIGNLTDFEDVVSASEELNDLSTIMCVRIVGGDTADENRLSVCFCNAEDLRIILAEFVDTDSFSLLEQCIVAQATVIKEPLEDVETCQAEIQMMLKPNQRIHPSAPLLQGLRTLLVHMQLLRDPKYEHSFSVLKYGSAGYMYTSNSTLQALEVFSTSDESDMSVRSSSAATLYDHLNRCRSQPGRRQLREWVRRPLFDLRQIRERLDVVEVLTTYSTTRQKLHEDLLRRVPDMSFLVRRLTQKKASLQDCHRLYQLINTLKSLNEVLKELNDCGLDINQLLSVNDLLAEPLQHSARELANFSELIENVVDLEYFERSGSYRVNPSIDPDLKELAKKLYDIEERAQNERAAYSRKLNCDSIRMDSSTEGYYFKVTAKVEQTIRGKITAIKTTKGDGVHFLSDVLSQLNVEFCELQAEYDAHQKKLRDQVIQTCRGYVPAFQRFSERIGVLDVLVSFALVASNSSSLYVRPQLLEKGTGVFELLQCRHPLVEQSPNMQFIPNDVHLTNGSGSRFVVLTGANMGGKSTYLKSAALTVFMAQMGCIVPCDSARFSMIDGIFTRVGAADYQFKGISTFMAEMCDCATTLEIATENSFIVIDELGRGTSTYDGFGLAWAIAEEIVTRVKCVCIFATHFHELSALKTRYPHVVNNLKVDTIVNEDGTLTILYQVSEGVADKSFGIWIAKMCDFPTEVIDDAAKILKQLEGSSVH
uniref:DNA mismatch repair proteins mutS family domain-containing protein n=1 Tax=Ditylenchus dipsaci TaxID=166011 RepID=A0A915D5Y3_9BILA